MHLCHALSWDSYFSWAYQIVDKKSSCRSNRFDSTIDQFFPKEGQLSRPLATLPRSICRQSNQCRVQAVWEEHVVWEPALPTSMRATDPAFEEAVMKSEHVSLLLIL